MTIIPDYSVTRKAKKEPDNTRRMPVFIDVFLYPLSLWGMSIISVCVFGPTVLRLLFLCLAKLCEALNLGALSLFILLPVGCFASFANIAFTCYLWWYFAKCINYSAAGQVRAPSIFEAGGDEGLGEMIWSMVRTLCSVLFYLAPAVIYAMAKKKTDAAFWALLGMGVFFAPMSLLAVVMFESFDGLKPTLIIGSIFSTFIHYIGIAVAFYLLLATMAAIIFSNPFTKIPFMGVFIKLIIVYLLYVTGHVLGWFFYRNEEKLYWEV